MTPNDELMLKMLTQRNAEPLVPIGVRPDYPQTSLADLLREFFLNRNPMYPKR